jgi:hypothetical protein
VHFHFTPTSASWLDQVEVWFSTCRGSRAAAPPSQAPNSSRSTSMPISTQITSKLSLRLDEEKGPSTPIQKPPYHPALISGTSSQADAPHRINALPGTCCLPRDSARAC